MRVVNPQDQTSTYAAVLDALPLAAYMANPDGAVTFLSSAWESYTGNSAQRVIADGFLSIIHEEDRARASATWAKTQSSGTSYRDEYRVRFGDGTYRWILSQAEPISTTDAPMAGWCGTFTDIDELKHAETALAESAATYRAISAAIPGVTWAASPAGELTFVGERWTAMHGKPREGALGESWLESVYPADRERVLAVWAHSLETGEEYDVQFRLRVHDGSYRWFLVRALPIHDDAGAIVRWVGVNVDIEDQRRADDAREQFVRLAEASDDFVGIGDEFGNLTFVNEAGRRMAGILSRDAAHPMHYLEYVAPGDRAFVMSEILPAVERDGRWSGEFWLRHFGTGERVPIAHQIFALRNRLGDRIGIAMVSRDIRERQRVEAGLMSLAETGAALFGSLDFDETLRNVALASTRSFASYCIVDTMGTDGRVRHVAAVHANPALGETVSRVAAARGLQRKHPSARALLDGVSSLIPALPDDWVVASGMDPAAFDDVRLLNPRSLICVPMRAAEGGATVGAISFVVDGNDPRGGYTGDDLRFAEEIALRAGLAFDHARAFERERRIAVTLQDASLPKKLPAVDYLRLSADYRPGNAEATIGGDWYDAFQLDDGRLAISVGDVLGNGLAAAVTMSKVRQAMRSGARVVPDVRVMLDVADRTIREESASAYATAIAGMFDPRSHEFTFASAGHPPPLIRHVEGTVEEVAGHGMMLGLRVRGDAVTTTIPVDAGAMLVFYTDGLVEATRDLAQGTQRLRDAFASDEIAAASNPAHALVERVLAGTSATDDIAVLVVTIGPQSAAQSESPPP